MQAESGRAAPRYGFVPVEASSGLKCFLQAASLCLLDGFPSDEASSRLVLTQTNKHIN
jgi:hypothetical protein